MLFSAQATLIRRVTSKYSELSRPVHCAGHAANSDFGAEAGGNRACALEKDSL